MYLHKFDIVDTLFSNERDLIACSFLQDFPKGKGSSLQIIYNAHTAFLLCEAVLFTLNTLIINYWYIFVDKHLLLIVNVWRRRGGLFSSAGGPTYTGDHIFFGKQDMGVVNKVNSQRSQFKVKGHVRSSGECNSDIIWQVKVQLQTN